MYSLPPEHTIDEFGKMRIEADGFRRENEKYKREILRLRRVNVQGLLARREDQLACGTLIPPVDPPGGSFPPGTLIFRKDQIFSVERSSRYQRNSFSKF